MDELKKILDIDISISLTPEQWSAVLEQVGSKTTEKIREPFIYVLAEFVR